MYKTFNQTLLFVTLLFCSQTTLKSQSMCGLDGGNNLSVSAGTLTAPDAAPMDSNGNYTIYVDGSDYQLYQQNGATADNGAVYPADASLPASVELPDGSFSSRDYAYIMEICPVAGQPCYLLSSLDGTLNPTDPAGDGSLPALAAGTQVCVSGFAFSLAHINAILDFVADPLICSVIEEELPEEYDCGFIQDLAEENIADLDDLFELTTLFGYPATSLPDALFSIWSVDRLLHENGFTDLTPCYSSSVWSTPALSMNSVLASLPDFSDEATQIAAISDQLEAPDYCISIIDTPDCSSLVSGGEIFAQDGTDVVEICIDDPNPDTLIPFGTSSTAASSYTYILTNPDGIIISQISDAAYDFMGVAETQFLIYGFSYTGELNAETGSSITDLASSDCFSLSSNSVSVTTTACSINNETIAAPLFTVFPNPSANGQFQLSGDITNITELNILDLQGRLIDNCEASNGGQLSLETLPNGSYLLQVFLQNNQMQMLKLLVLR